MPCEQLMCKSKVVRCTGGTRRESLSQQRSSRSAQASGLWRSVAFSADETAVFPWFLRLRPFPLALPIAVIGCQGGRGQRGSLPDSLPEVIRSPAQYRPALPPAIERDNGLPLLKGRGPAIFSRNDRIAA